MSVAIGWRSVPPRFEDVEGTSTYLRCDLYLPGPRRPCGALPLVHQMFPQTPIYTTLPTHRLSTIMLGDAVRVQESNGEKLFSQESVDTAVFAKYRMKNVKTHTLRMRL